MHVGYSYFSKTESPTLVAQIPHPAVGGQSRTASASTGELSHSESAWHTHLLWMIPLSEEIELAVLVGPSFYSINQDFRRNRHPGGNAALQLGRASAQSSHRAVGHAQWLLRPVSTAPTWLTPKFGIGAFFRYSGASADMPLSGGGTRHGRGGWHSDRWGLRDPVLGHCRQASSLQLRLGRHALVSPNVEDDDDEEDRSFITVSGRAWPSRPSAQAPGAPATIVMRSGDRIAR